MALSEVSIVGRWENKGGPADAFRGALLFLTFS